MARGEALGPVRLDQGGLRRPYRHHRRHLLPRRGLVLLPAGRRHRVRRPDHPPARRQVPELHGAGGPRPRLGGGQLLLDGAAALGRRLPGVPPPPSARHGARSRWRPSCSVRPVLPALGRVLPGHHRRAAHRPAPLLRPAGAPVRRSSSWTASATISRCARSRRPSANGELHRFDDFLQRSFNELTGLIANAFFLHPPVAAEPTAIECRAGLSGRPATDDAASRSTTPPSTAMPGAGAVRRSTGRCCGHATATTCKLRSADARRLAGAPKCAGCTTCSATRSPCSTSQPGRGAADREPDRDPALSRLDQPGYLSPRRPSTGRSPTAPRTGAISARPSSATIPTRTGTSRAWALQLLATPSCGRSSC